MTKVLQKAIHSLDQLDSCKSQAQAIIVSLTNNDNIETLTTTTINDALSIVLEKLNTVNDEVEKLTKYIALRSRQHESNDNNDMLHKG